MAPDVQAQMGGPKFGSGMQQAQDQAGQDPIDKVVATVEKMLLAVDNEAFKRYAMEAIAKIKIGAGMAKQQQPQSQGAAGGGPPQAPPPKMNVPPMPGQMPV
jgi:hypothetical protein